MTQKKSQKQKQEKLTKKERAELERAAHKKLKQKKKEKHLSSKKTFSLPFVTGIILVIVASVSLIFIGFFLFQKIFAARDIANFLPARETIALIEIDTADRNARNFFQELQAYPAFREDALQQILVSETGINFDTDIRPWFGKKAGLAFLNINGNTGRVLFLETKNRKKTPNITGQSTNFLDRYAIFSENSDLLSELVNAQKKGDVLSKNPWYLSAHSNLPDNFPIFAYGNIELLMSRKSLGTLAFFAPMAKIYPSMGFSASFENGKLLGKSFLALSKNSLAGESSFERKYDGALLPLVSQENLLFLMGGRDFPGEFQQTLSLMNTVHPSAAIVAEGMLRAQKDKYFDPLVSLENDIYPLLRDEYVISVHKTDNGQSFDLALHLNDPSADLKKLIQLTETFSRKAALADSVGATGQELTSDDSVIATLRFSDRDFFYAFSPNSDIFLLSSDRSFVAYGLKSLNSQTPFSLPAMEKILSVTNDINAVHSDFFALEKWQTYLEPFGFLFFGNSRSNDGVSTFFTLSLR
ncbi:hypothetical protein HZA41_01375 [Candidatus Peregrinibacteria bacterium]|nr:hypothetical protein [Candidatus Peregrinibacteria bacterium]